MSILDITCKPSTNLCVPIILTLSLIGCDKPATEVVVEPSHDRHAHDGHTHDEHAHDEHAPHDHHHELESGRIAYHCSPEQSIFVSYDFDNQPRTAHLLIDGIEYDLSATSINKDAHNMDYTYISDIGLDDTHGLIWQTNQDNAILKAPELAQLDNADAASQLFDCHKE